MVSGICFTVRSFLVFCVCLVLYKLQCGDWLMTGADLEESSITETGQDGNPGPAVELTEWNTSQTGRHQRAECSQGRPSVTWAVSCRWLIKSVEWCVVRRQLQVDGWLGFSGILSMQVVAISCCRLMDAFELSVYLWFSCWVRVSHISAFNDMLFSFMWCQ